MSKQVEEQTKKRLCVMIGPWGATDIEQTYRKDLEYILDRVFGGPEYDFRKYWEMPKADMQAAIYTMLITADLLIVDLRGTNPNVMYELGIRHAFNLPTIPLKDPGTKLPWDIDKNLVIEYPLPLQACFIDETINRIREQVNKVDSLASEKRPSYSTFYSAVQRSAAIQGLDATPELKGILTGLVNKVDSLASNQQTMDQRLLSLSAFEKLQKSVAFNPTGPTGSAGPSGSTGIWNSMAISAPLGMANEVLFGPNHTERYQELHSTANLLATKSPLPSEKK